MSMKQSAIVLSIAAAALGLGRDPRPDTAGALRQGFAEPPPESRIMMRWWWFGPAVEKQELERELRAMKEAGIGGIEIQPVYPLALDDPERGIRNLPFLSPEFLEAVRFASLTAQDLGLRVDLTLGTGWPYGGPHVRIEQAAANLRVERVPAGGPRPALREGEHLVGTFSTHPSSARQYRQVSGGAAFLPAEENETAGERLYFIASRTRMQVKRAADSGEGYVLDHYNRAALEEHFQHVGVRLLAAIGPTPPHAIFCDSLEVFGSDWTADLLDQFRNRRGYDLRPFLPALAGDIGPITGAIRHDWALTLTEMTEDRFLRPLQDWARRHRTLLRVQTYGTPPVTLYSQKLVDLPEGEGSHWRKFTPSRWASSANHALGRQVTSSETWTWLHSPSFAATPLDLKAEADRHFLQGINQLVGHGWPYSPKAAGKPGWAFYAAAALNDSNPWWIAMPDVARYLQRMSWLMRQGEPVTDVAVYLPISDARAAFSLGQVSIDRSLEAFLGTELLPSILDAGFNFDGIDDGLLQNQCRVERGALRAAGQRYRAVILPGIERMPPASLRKLEQFARSGGVVIATRRTPSLAPGYVNAGAQTTELRAIAARLFEGERAPGRLIDEDAAAGEALARAVQPDAAVTPANENIGIVHRRAGDADIYFVANTGNMPFRGTGRFRVDGKRLERWDAMSGGAHPAPSTRHDGGGTAAEIDLAPYESAVLVFLPGEQPAAAASVLAGPAGTTQFASPWTVQFEGGERNSVQGRLQSWTEDARTRFFSGTAAYENTVVIPASDMAPGVAWLLDFGEPKPLPERTHRQTGMRAWLDAPVRDAAVVFVNSKRAGAVWCPPYALDITPFLKPGENHIRVVVGNTALNHMASVPASDYSALNQRYGVRFTPQDIEDVKPQPSGIIGEVRLQRRGAAGR